MKKWENKVCGDSKQMQRPSFFCLHRNILDSITSIIRISNLFENRRDRVLR